MRRGLKQLDHRIDDGDGVAGWKLFPDEKGTSGIGDL
jgi:hypothetical protein